MYYSNLPPKEYEELKRMIVETLLNGMELLVTDAKGQFLFVTDEFCKDVGLPPEKVLSMTVEEAVRENHYSHSATLMTLNSKRPMNTICRSANGNLSIGRSSIVPNETGEIQYVMTEGMSVPSFVSILTEMLGRNADSYEVSRMRKLMYEYNSQVIFRSHKMFDITKRAEKIAMVDSSVLITGESGVGKDVIAKYIHNHSPRKNNAFVPICVPLIPPTLLESELFGYKGGAFTGAHKGGKEGLFEMANGGTVFLDEIGDIQMDLQVKLLRVLENQEIFRVGGTEPIHLDLRIIAATNKNLQQMVKEGKFREDLLYRLNVLSVKIPPLRERPEDIAVLAEFFLKEINEKYQFHKLFSPRALKVLETYDWPGNIRELKHAVEKFVILSDDNIMDYPLIQSILFEDSAQRAQTVLAAVMAGEATDAKASDPNIIDSYHRMRREQLLQALMEANGNKSKAAKMLGISRSKLYKELKGIE